MRLHSSRGRVHTLGAFAAAAAAAAAIAWCASAADPSDAFRVHYGETDMDLAGFAVAEVGDLDNDGFAEYVVGSPGWGLSAGRAIVYSGATGIAMFTLTGTPDTSLAGFALANAGDVNNDGYNDIIMGAPVEFVGLLSVGSMQVRSGYDGSVIHWLYGFADNACFGWAVAGAGDIDNDGYDDVAVASPFAGPGTVEVFSGLTGSLLRQHVYTSGNAQFGRSLANIGDVNGDGFDELLIGAPQVARAFIFDSRNTQIIRTFHLPSGGEFGRAVASAGDIDGDGANEVIVGAPALGRAYVYNGATGALIHEVAGSAAAKFGLAVGSIADFDGDAYPDFAVGSPDGGRVDVFSGASGQPIWVASSSNTDFGHSLAGVSDISGDGYNEILVGDPGVIHAGAAGAGYLFSGSPVAFGLGVPQSYNVSGATPLAVHTADMNVDGKQDIVSLSNNRIEVFASTGNGTLAPPAPYTVSGATAMAVADINFDNRPDVLVTSTSNPQIRLYRNSTTGLIFSGTLTGVATPTSAALADFNNDGRVDLAVTDSSNKTVRIWLGNNSSSTMLSERFTYKAKYPVGDGPIQVMMVHLNSDAFLDLAILNKTSQTVSILSNKGNSTFAVRTPVALEGAPYSMTFADFNGDGKQDLATVIAGSNKVSIRKGKPSFTFGDPKLQAVGAGPRVVFARDLNGDQRPDLITANWAYDVLTVRLKGESNFAFAPAMTQSTGLDPVAVATLDIDGDGDIDLATLNKSSRTISIVPSTLVD